MSVSIASPYLRIRSIFSKFQIYMQIPDGCLSYVGRRSEWNAVASHNICDVETFLPEVEAFTTYRERPWIAFDDTDHNHDHDGRYNGTSLTPDQVPSPLYQKSRPIWMEQIIPSSFHLSQLKAGMRLRRLLDIYLMLQFLRSPLTLECPSRWEELASSCCSDL